jgi:predicted nucleic-acid-binding Zn-ribbon protein
MPTSRCPKCGYEDFEEKMFAVYDMWGQFEEMRAVKVCKKCGTELPEEDEKKEEK